MNKYTTRLIAYLVAVCMLLCMLPVAYASDLTYKVEGEAYLFAPPAGVKSAVTYNLIETDTSTNSATVVDGAVLTTSGTVPAGVFVFDNMLILDGDTIKSGSFTVTLTAGSKTASLNVAVQSNRFYADFEGLTFDDLKAEKVKHLYDTDTGDVLAGKEVQVDSRITSGALITETVNGETNTYVKSNWNAYIRFMLNQIANWTETRNVTIDVMTGGKTLLQHPRRNTEMTPSLYTLIGYGSTDTGPVFNLNSTTATMKHVRLNLNLRNRTYNAWVDGIKTAADAEINSAYDASYLDSVRFYEGTFDNLAIYSGAPVDVTLSGNIPEKLLVGSKGVKIPLKISAEVDGKTKEVSAVWESSSQDVSADGQFLTVNPNASGSVVLTATYCGTSKEFNIALDEAVEDYQGTDSYTIDTDSADGILTLRGKVTGENVLIKGLGSDISVGSCADAELCVFIDKYNKEYTIISDNKKIAKSSYSTIGDVQLVADTVSVVYFGNIFDEAPVLADVKIVGKPNINQSLSLDGDIYSYIYGEEACTYITKWYIDGVKVSESQSLLISDSNIGQIVSGELSVSVEGTDQTLTGTPVSTEGVVISDMYQLSEIPGGVRVSVAGSGERMQFIVVADWTNDGITQEITAKSYDGYDEDINVDIFAPSNCSYDNVRVSLLNNDFSPLASSKLLSGTDNMEKANLQEKKVLFADNKLSVYDPTEQLGSVIIFNPKANNNFADSYTAADIDVDTGGTILTEQICYINVLKGNVKIPVTTNKNGYHTVSVIFSDDTTLETDFVSGAKALFENNIISSMHTNIANTDVKDEFKLIIKNCLNADSTIQEAVLASFIKTNPSYVNTLMKGEEYDISKLNTSILLATFLNDKNEETALTKNLTEEGYDVTAPSLLAKNKNFSASVQKVVLSNGISQALNSMKETAILAGVAESVNYLETKVYLEAIGDIAVTDSMANDFTGKSYNSFSALKSALTAYTPTSGGGSGGGSGSSSGSLPGSSSNAGGFVGGGSSAAPVTQQPNNQQTAHRFSDLAPTHWAYDDIMFLADKGIINGMDDNSYAPERTITRAEYVKILTSAFSVTSDKPSASFNDVDKDDWFYDYVVNASKAGIIEGDGNSFKPNDNITRQDAAVMLYRVLMNMGAAFNDSESIFTDSEAISEYALEAVNSLCSAGILNGMDDGSFKPLNYLTRSQAAAIVARVLK